MSACSETCRKATGTRFEHCKVCHFTFGGHALGDAHRQVSGTYVLAKPSSKAKSSTVQRFASEEEIPKGWYLIPGVSNTYRCLSVEEMEERGWRLVDNVWRGPKVDEEKWDRLKAASPSNSDYHAAAMGDTEEPEDDWDEQAVS